MINLQRTRQWILLLAAALFLGATTESTVVTAQDGGETAVSFRDDNSETPITPPQRPSLISYPMTAQTAQSSSIINLSAFRSDPRFAGIDGSGVAVVVLDTGIDLDDPFFGPDADSNGVADRIVYHQDFGDDDMDASDVHGHGSNVSSIVGASDATFAGMAPGVDLIHLKVFRDDGTGNFAMLEDALQWIIANAATYNIVSINMSLGNTANYSAPQQLFGIGDELGTIRNSLGITAVSSSGNDFFGFFSQQGVGYPAADPNSLSVGAIYDANIGGTVYGNGAQAFSTAPFRVAPFSQRHHTLTTILAPGAAIVGAGPNDALTSMHGTSQAAPHIAGIVALMQELALQELGRLLTPNEVESLLVSTALLVNDGDDEDDNVTNTGLNFPLVDVLGLGEAILAMKDITPPIVTQVGSVADTGDGVLTDGERSSAAITQLTVTFNKAMQDPAGSSEAGDVTNPANYRLVSAGDNGVVQSGACAALAGNDVALVVDSVSYDGGSQTATLGVNGGTLLASDSYRLFACAEGALRDEADNPLDGNGDGTGGDDFTLDFEIDRDAPGVKEIQLGGSPIADAGTANMLFNTIDLAFDEPMDDLAGDSGSDDVTNPANYALLYGGANGVVNTAVCTSPTSDDQLVPINSVLYSAASQTGTLNLNNGTDLVNGAYAFAICGTLRDTVGNELPGGSVTLTFTIDLPDEPITIYLPLMSR